MNNTTSALIALVLAFAVTAALGKVLIPWLHKLKFGQNILTDIGPSWHAKKQGTPTMGGIMFIIGITGAALVTILICYFAGFSVFSENSELRSAEIVKLVSGFLLAIFSALIGFADDYIKVVKKRNLGLTEIQKTIPQLIIIARLSCFNDNFWQHLDDCSLCRQNIVRHGAIAYFLLYSRRLHDLRHN